MSRPYDIVQRTRNQLAAIGARALLGIQQYVGLAENDAAPSPPRPLHVVAADETAFKHPAPISEHTSLTAMDTLPAADETDGPVFRWRKHPVLLNREPLIRNEERDARHEAVRGLFAAQAGAHSCAEEHFTRAARVYAIDLTDIPGFWALSRTAMLTAVTAYENAGRLRDAAALSARIRTLYRPRALNEVPSNVTALPSQPAKASNS